MPISKVDSFSRLFDTIQSVWLRHYFSHLPSFILLNSAHKPQKQTKQSKYSEWLILSKQYSALCLIKNLIDISQHRKMEAHTASEIQLNISTCDKHTTRPATVWELWAVTMPGINQIDKFLSLCVGSFHWNIPPPKSKQFYLLAQMGLASNEYRWAFRVHKNRALLWFFYSYSAFPKLNLVWLIVVSNFFSVLGFSLRFDHFMLLFFQLCVFFLLSSAPNGSVLGSKQTTVEKQ